MRVKDKDFYLREKEYLKKLKEQRQKLPTKPLRNVKLMCLQLEFWDWLQTPDANCKAYNELELLYRQKWDAENNKLPEPLMSKALRKAADESVESALESFCDVQMRLINNFMC